MILNFDNSFHKEKTPVREIFPDKRKFLLHFLLLLNIHHSIILVFYSFFKFIIGDICL